jgi:hypothetical protein
LPTSPSASPLLGARHPRVEVGPADIAYTLGPEAIELSRRAGQCLDPWQCDAVELMLSCRADGRWACFTYVELCPRQNGKGGILEARALAGLFLLGEKLIIWSAHEYKTALQAFGRLRALIDNFIEAGVVDAADVKVTETNGKEAITYLPTGQVLKIIARSKGSGRGFSGDLVIIDEAFALTEDQRAAQMPTILARPNPQIIYTSTPPLDGYSAAGQPLYTLRTRALSDTPGALGYRDWGIAGDLEHVAAIDLDDQRLWAAANPSVGIRISRTTLMEARQGMSDVAFARECLGVWPRQHLTGGAIDPQLWAQLADSRSRRAGAVALGVDIAPQRDYAAIALYGVRADGLEHTQLLRYKPGTDWIVTDLVELATVLDPVAIGMGRGTYLSLQTELAKAGFSVPQEPHKPDRGDLAVTTGAEMAAACGQILDAVRHQRLRHLGQRELDVAVQGAQTRQAGDVIAWSRTVLEVDTSPLVAVTTARWAYYIRVDALHQPIAPATARTATPEMTDRAVYRPTGRLTL